MIKQPYQSLWDVEKAKSGGYYFYDIPIEHYISETEVHVTGFGKMIMFGGYSYLSLHKHPQIQAAAKAALEQYGTGGPGVRLLAGTTPLHKALEKSISQFKKTEDAVTYSSGYIANISVISALVGRNDVIFSDQLNHASLNDACTLSRAHLFRFRHNDLEHLEKLLQRNHRGRKLILVDGVYSMDGDIADLPKLVRLSNQYNCILAVDECHAIGVLGKTGTGLEEHYDLPPGSIDIKIGTLSKAIPSQGGFVAANSDICQFLRHQSKGFIYSGANSPVSDAASISAIAVIQSEPERLARLQENTEYAHRCLAEAGFNTLSSQTPIIPIFCGDDQLAYDLAKSIRSSGLFIQAIPYPVVPKGKARLRLSINSGHDKKQIDFFVGRLEESAKKYNLFEITKGYDLNHTAL